MNSKNILITGASGLIGTALSDVLNNQRYHVAHLSRSPRSGKAPTFVWDVDKNFIDPEAFKTTDTIIHLAGAGIADKRWTIARKRELLESRTKSTHLLYQELKKGNHQIKTFIAASAIGYYGFDDPDKTFTEESAAGKDFLATVVRKWEDEVDRIASLNIRVVKIRIGIVLSEKGGALKEIVKPVKYFVGAPLGTGKQYLSWIHLDDLCAVFLKALEDEQMKGAYNATGPYAVTNRELTNTIAKVLKRPLILHAVPAFVLKLALGEMADLVLKGSKVSSKKIQNAGFVFKFPTLEGALKDLLK